MVRRREDLFIEIHKPICSIPPGEPSQAGILYFPPPETSQFCTILDKSFYVQNSKEKRLVKREDEYKNQKRLKVTLADLLWY